MSEQWRDVPGFTGLYEVSSFGRVRNSTGVVLKPYSNARGYCWVKMYTGDKRRYATSVHRLVLSVFVGECPIGMQCAHLDGDKSNNRVENLAWVSPKENASHRRLHGTSGEGVTNAFSKLTAAEVGDIRKEFRTRKEGSNSAALAKKYGVHRDTIADAALGRTYLDVQLAPQPLADAVKKARGGK